MGVKRRSDLAAVVAITAAWALVFGGCTSEVNRPLPRMSKKYAHQRSHHLADSMARSASVRLDAKTVRPHFNACVGKHDEVPEDGRFVLDYSARAKLPVNEHFRVAERVRDDLKRDGYRIEGLQEIRGKNQSVILDASSPEKGFSISVEGDHTEDSLLFAVSTPCLMPPGKKQKQY